MADLPPGHVLGDRFEVVGVLGHGGMATVYLVHDRLRETPVALKILHGHLSRSTAMRSRLRREVLAASRLRHPNALVAWDLHELDGTLAVSMPLHKGRTLAGYVDRHGPLTAGVLEKVAGQLVSALREAHATGIVHRDVTPTNVMVSEDGDAVLTDFGLARFTDQRTATGTGALGTAGYAAPEVYAGVRSDPRSDIYGLGAVLYMAATGQAPFHAPDPMGILRKQMDDDRVPLAKARPDLPEHLTATIDAMLAVDPAARPQGAADVEAALQAHRPAVVSTPPKTTALAPRPHLPPGEWTVVVEEHRGQRDRRRHVRERMRRRGGFESNVEKVLSEVGRRLMTDLLGVSTERSPEQLLTRAVALEADLPGDALMVPSTMLERRFRLVERVSERSAQRLARSAEQAGFRTRVLPVTAVQEDGDEDRTWLGTRSAVFLSVALVMAAVALSIGMITGLGPFVEGFAPMPWLLFLFVPFVVINRRRRVREDRADLPVAFGTDLRFHLSPDHDALLPPPAREATPQTAPGPAAPVPAQAPRHAALLQRTQDQLDALERAIEDNKDVLPGIALRDLRGTLLDLRTEVTRLGKTADALHAELSGLDEAGAAAAVDRIEGRLERVRTLARTGDTTDAEEAPRLEAALTSHREVLEQAEVLEGRLTLVLARLLEAGSAATRARVDLLDPEQPQKSAEDLLAQLEQQTAGAREALAEVGGRLPKEPIAAGEGERQRRKRQPT